MYRILTGSKGKYLCVPITFFLLTVSQLYSQTSEDTFQWLEEIDGEKQLEWVDAHNKTTLDYIYKIEGYQDRYDFVYGVLTSEHKIAYPQLEGDYIYNFWQDGNNPRGIFRRIPVQSYLVQGTNWEILIDLDSLSASDSINWVFKGVQFAPFSNNRCIVGLSEGGSDALYLKEFDLNSRHFILQGFTVEEAKSDFQWIDDDHIYISSDFGEGSLTSSGYARFIKRWERGTKLEDAEIVFEASPDDMAVAPIVIHDAKSTYEFILHFTDFYRKSLYYIDDTCLIRLPLPDDFNFDMLGENVILCPFVDWKLNEKIIEKGTVISIRLDDLKQGIANYELLFEASERISVEGIYTTSNSLIINTLDNIKNVIFKYTYVSGVWNHEQVQFPPSGSIDIVDVNKKSPYYFASFESFTQPTTLYIDKSDGKDPVKVMNLPSYFDGSACEVTQYEARSYDGTMIPYFVIYKKGLKFDGQNPTILYGYGGFQVAEKPFYSASLGKLWLENGGIYAIANIRGGGEFGPDWHNAAILENKQKSFDDFIAVAEDLQSRKITSPERLGITGGSNGGLLVGAVMLQRPDLFDAVVCIVPLLDMKRFSKLLAGQSWVAEYGDPDDPEEWEYIQKYSPYHNVKQGQVYPHVIFLTSTRDDRVHPGHARKMTAKMESMGYEVYLFENTEGGHAATYTPEQHAKLISINYSFFTDRLHDHNQN